MAYFTSSPWYRQAYAKCILDILALGSSGMVGISSPSKRFESGRTGPCATTVTLTFSVSMALGGRQLHL